MGAPHVLGEIGGTEDQLAGDALHPVSVPQRGWPFGPICGILRSRARPVRGRGPFQVAMTLSRGRTEVDSTWQVVPRNRSLCGLRAPGRRRRGPASGYRAVEAQRNRPGTSPHRGAIGTPSPHPATRSQGDAHTTHPSGSAAPAVRRVSRRLMGPQRSPRSSNSPMLAGRLLRGHPDPASGHQVGAPPSPAHTPAPARAAGELGRGIVSARRGGAGRPGRAATTAPGAGCGSSN